MSKSIFELYRKQFAEELETLNQKKTSTRKSSIKEDPEEIFQVASSDTSKSMPIRKSTRVRNILGLSD